MFFIVFVSLLAVSIAPRTSIPSTQKVTHSLSLCSKTGDDFNLERLSLSESIIQFYVSSPTQYEHFVCSVDVEKQLFKTFHPIGKGVLFKPEEITKINNQVHITLDSQNYPRKNLTLPLFITDAKHLFLHWFAVYGKNQYGQKIAKIISIRTPLEKYHRFDDLTGANFFTLILPKSHSKQKKRIIDIHALCFPWIKITLDNKTSLIINFDQILEENEGIEMILCKKFLYPFSRSLWAIKGRRHIFITSIDDKENPNLRVQTKLFLKQLCMSNIKSSHLQTILSQLDASDSIESYFAIHLLDKENFSPILNQHKDYLTQFLKKQSQNKKIKGNLYERASFLKNLIISQLSQIQLRQMNIHQNSQKKSTNPPPHKAPHTTSQSNQNPPSEVSLVKWHKINHDEVHSLNLSNSKNEQSTPLSSKQSTTTNLQEDPQIETLSSFGNLTNEATPIHSLTSSPHIIKKDFLEKTPLETPIYSTIPSNQKKFVNFSKNINDNNEIIPLIIEAEVIPQQVDLQNKEDEVSLVLIQENPPLSIYQEETNPICSISLSPLLTNKEQIERTDSYSFSPGFEQSSPMIQKAPPLINNREIISLTTKFKKEENKQTISLSASSTPLLIRKMNLQTQSLCSLNKTNNSPDTLSLIHPFSLKQETENIKKKKDLTRYFKNVLKMLKHHKYLHHQTVLKKSA